MVKKRKQFSKQFKEDAIELITEHEYKTAEAGRNFGLHHRTLKDNGKMNLKK